MHFPLAAELSESRGSRDGDDNQNHDTGKNFQECPHLPTFKPRGHIPAFSSLLNKRLPVSAATRRDVVGRRRGMLTFVRVR